MGVSEIVVSYYVDSIGPTIRIDIESLTDLLLVKGLFQKLAEGTSYEVNLHDLRNTAMMGIEGLTLKLVPKEERRTLKRVGDQTGRPVFIWSRTREGWDDCVALIDGLAASESPGHQYLTQEGIDSALVEVSFLEHHHKHREN